MIRMIEPVSPTVLDTANTLVFAGGGNRCWWQAGVMEHLRSAGWRLPAQLLGTSAGAGVAASCLTTGPRAALEACQRLYAANTGLFAWRGLWRGRLRFAQQHIYPTWVESFLNADVFDTLRHSPHRLRVGFTRPARALGLAGSVVMGSVLYALDRRFQPRLHPRLPRWLGLRQDWADLQSARTLEEAQLILLAAAAAPPLLRARQIAGRPALDGGYVDSAPIPPQTTEERSTTLVLLTRHDCRLPTLFRFRERTYWQPSRPVPVSTWDCRARTNVRDAFELGMEDAHRLAGGS